MPARRRCKLLGAIAPVIKAAEQPHQHDFRPRADLLDIKIDGIRMFQLGQRSQPQARVAGVIMGSGEQREVTVGEGQDDDVRGRLFEVDGLRRLVQ